MSLTQYEKKNATRQNQHVRHAKTSYLFNVQILNSFDCGDDDGDEYHAHMQGHSSRRLYHYLIMTDLSHD